MKRGDAPQAPLEGAVDRGAGNGAAAVERRARVGEGLASLLGRDAVRARGGSEAGSAVEIDPAGEEQVAAVLRLASEEGWRVVPVGAGTWLNAGDPLEDSDVFLRVSALDRIVQYEPADLTITVGAGLGLEGLRAAAGAERQWLPLDPPGARHGTVGATLATSSAGGLASSYGGPRDLCLGLRFVTGDGRVLSFGGKVVKNVAGFDMVKLAVGSWGTLGVISEATLRLNPVPETETLLVARAPRLEELVEAARSVAVANAPPAAVELLERPGPGTTREAVLSVRVHGLPERVAREAALLEERMRPLLVERIEEAESLRRGIAELEGSADLVLRLLLPPAQLGDLLDVARGLGRTGAGHDELTGAPLRIAGDGARAALTVAIPNLRQDPEQTALWALRLREVRRALELRGGSLTLLAGSRDLVKAVGAWGGVGAATRVMSRLKAQFDPAGILSPGRAAYS